MIFLVIIFLLLGSALCIVSTSAKRYMAVSSHEDPKNISLSSIFLGLVEMSTSHSVRLRSLCASLYIWSIV